MHGTFSNESQSRDLENTSFQSDESSSNSQPKSPRIGWSFLLIPMFVLLFGAGLLDWKGTFRSSSTSQTTSLQFAGSKTGHSDPSYKNQIVPTAKQMITAVHDNLKSIEARNEYGVYSAPYPFFDDYPGSQLVEPYKKTWITLSGKYTKNSDNTYLWEIEGQSEYYTGTTIEITLKTTGTFTVNVHAFDSDDKYLSSYTTTIFVKYVKREIRSLTVPDREKFLDAMAKIWTVSSSEGKKLYGENFNSIHTFVREHAIASGDIMCDQFHEGSGFLTHHLALANSFENAMRAVDPSVTLHYWDFTVEGQQIEDAGMNPSYITEISPAFTSTWFGSVSNDNLIQDSRWAHLAMPMVEKGDAPNTPHNSYGYIRSYWNNNDNPEITRHMFDTCGTEPLYKEVPNCQHHYDVLNVKSLGDFQMDSPGDAHGPMHVQMGGMYGGCVDKMSAFTKKYESYLDEDLTVHDITLTGQNAVKFISHWGSTGQRRVMFNKAIVGEYFHIYRGFWRSHMCAVDDQPYALVCPDSCDPDSTAFEDCTCSVPAIESGTMDWTNLLPCLLNSESNREYFNKTFTVEFMEELTYTLATASVKEGEMLEAASPADVVFWMIHTVIERLLAAKRLEGVTDMGGTEFYKWGGPMGREKTSWNTQSYYNLRKGQNKWYNREYTCYGHAADDDVLPDVLPFTEIMKNADSDGNGKVSNWEFYEALDPANPSLNDYVFDNFKWDHCEGKIESDSDDDETTTYGGSTSVNAQKANRRHVDTVETNTMTVQAEEEQKQATMNLSTVQSTFTVKQLTLVMALVVCAVMLMTWIQFTLNVRDKSVVRTTSRA